MIMTVRTFPRCWRTDGSMLLVLFLSLSLSRPLYSPPSTMISFVMNAVNLSFYLPLYFFINSYTGERGSTKSS